MRILLILLLSTVVAWANPIDDKCPEHVLLGAPVSKIKKDTQYLCKTNYAIHYRYDKKIAEYVVEHVTLTKVTGPAKRRDDFRPDPEIPAQYRAELSDYRGQPYDRGHLAPAANNSLSDAMMSESFFLSNMVPQVPNHNRGIWKKLEGLVRDWVVKEGMDIYVISGTGFLPDHKTIGDNNIAVPTYLWKVIVDAKGGKAIAFMFENKPLDPDALSTYVMPIWAIEKATGINFMPKLPKERSRIEKEKANLRLWPGLTP